MNAEKLIYHVEDSIARALRHQSWIDASILDINGMSTGVMRRLISNICHLPKAKPSYLEIGMWAGASFCAAINNNPTLSATGIENFSQPFNNKNVRAELEINIARYRSGAREVRCVDADCFCAPIKTTGPFDVYFYDGEHSFESQAKALPHWLHTMADLFLFMVDDTNWPCVHDGTEAGFKALEGKVRVLKQWTLKGEVADNDPVWHNGMELFVCEKV